MYRDFFSIATRDDKLDGVSPLWGLIVTNQLADMKELLLETDEWYRRRLRMVIWKQWKRISTALRT